MEIFNYLCDATLIRGAKLVHKNDIPVKKVLKVR